MIKFGADDVQDPETPNLGRFGKDFEEFIETYVIKMFADKIPEALTTVFGELNLPESIMSQVKCNKRQMKANIK